MIRGITLGLYNRWNWINPDGSLTPGAIAAIDNIKACNATHAILVTSIIQDNINSQWQRFVEWNPTPRDFQRIRNACISRGLKVGVKIHVDPMDNNYRQQINPADLDQWAGFYMALVESYIDRCVTPEAVFILTEQEGLGIRDPNIWSPWTTRLKAKWPSINTLAIAGAGLHPYNPAHRDTQRSLNQTFGAVGASLYPGTWQIEDWSTRAAIANALAASWWLQDAQANNYRAIPTEWHSGTPDYIRRFLGACADVGIVDTVAWFPPDTEAKRAAFREFWT
jgi:hypothetical protein